MSVADTSTIVMAGAAALALIAAIIAWFYKRGATEQTLTKAVLDNSQATRDLTARLESFMARYEERHEALVTRVNGHDTRLGITETRVRANTLDIARLWPIPGPTSVPAGDPHHYPDDDPL